MYYRLRATIFYWLHPTNVLKIDQVKSRQYHTPSMMIFHSTFQTLVNYVENTLARATITKQNSLMLTRFKMNFFPRSWRRNISRELGLKSLEVEAIQAKVNFNAPELAKVKTRLAELYTWYEDEYPLLALKTNKENEPEYCCIDKNGNPVDTMLTTDGNIFAVNKISEQYMRYLESEMEMENTYAATIENKLQELLDLRSIMI